MAEYRIDELAQAAGSTVRNVRAYQERGLLRPPRRQGRVGLYDDGHLARLQLVGRLLDRGYTINNITELFTAWEHGRDLSDVLGLEKAVSRFYSDEPTTTLTRDELAHALNDPNLSEDERIRAAVEIGIAVPSADGSDRYQIPSPRMLRAVGDLVEAGVPSSAVLSLGAHLQRTVDDTAERFIAVVSDFLFRGRDADWMPSGDEIPALANFLARVRPAAADAVHAALARALDHHLDLVFGEYIDRLTPLLPRAEVAGADRA